MLVKDNFLFFSTFFQKIKSKYFVAVYRFPAATKVILSLLFEDVNRKLYLFFIYFSFPINALFSAFIHYTTTILYSNCMNCVSFQLLHLLLYTIHYLLFTSLYNFQIIKKEAIQNITSHFSDKSSQFSRKGNFIRPELLLLNDTVIILGLLDNPDCRSSYFTCLICSPSV